MTRTVPLATAQTASAVIGVFGGDITLPGAGLTLHVPAFAVTSPTLFTVTAVAGAQVAYEFEPHGAQFLVPLIVTQSLTGTSASPLQQLSAGYFHSVLDLDPLNGKATVSELLGTSISVMGNTVSFSVHHFSGYLIGTGRAGAEGDGSQQ